MSHYKIEVIPREFIPDDIYIPTNRYKQDIIFKISFANGLDFYVNSESLEINPNLSKRLKIFKIIFIIQKIIISSTRIVKNYMITMWVIRIKLLKHFVCVI